LFPPAKSLIYTPIFLHASLSRIDSHPKSDNQPALRTSIQPSPPSPWPIAGTSLSILPICVLNPTEMVGLHSVPVELLQEIASFVCGRHFNAQILTRHEVRDLCIMRCVCRFMNDIAEPLLFRHLAIHISPGSGTHEMPWHRQLRDLTNGSSNASIHAQAVSVHLYDGNWGKFGCIDTCMVELGRAVRSLLRVTFVK
jgi:hypothetical protein